MEAVPTTSFSPQEPVEENLERRSNDLETILKRTTSPRGDGANSLDELPRRQLVGWLVEEGDQAVVTTMAQHVEVPPRRYPWGRPESKYIESPESSVCSWPSM